MQIPFLSESELPVGQQCQMPNHVNVRRLLKSYVLHLVGAYQRDGRKVKAVKVYRVRHQSLSLQEYRKGIKEPWDPDTFVSVYMGDFDTHGEPLNLSSDLALPVYIASSVGLMCPALGEGTDAGGLVHILPWKIFWRPLPVLGAADGPRWLDAPGHFSLLHRASMPATPPGFATPRENGWKVSDAMNAETPSSSATPADSSRLSYWREWEEFWFRPADPIRLGLIRIGTGLVVLMTFATYAFDLQTFLGKQAWLNTETAARRGPQQAARADAAIGK